MTQTQENKTFDYITVDGKEPEEPRSFISKRVERAGYVLAVVGGILIYLLIFH